LATDRQTERQHQSVKLPLHCNINICSLGSSSCHHEWLNNNNNTETVGLMYSNSQPDYTVRIAALKVIKFVNKKVLRIATISNKVYGKTNM